MIRLRSLVWSVLVMLLSLSVQASDTDSSALSALFAAAEEGNLEVVIELVQGNPQLITVADDGGYSPLHKAAYNNHPDIAEYLLSHGADIDAASGSGSTPLHGAAFYGHWDIVRLLLNKGAAIDAVNAGGYTPLLSACAGNRSECARLLIEGGADVNAVTGAGRTPLFQAVWNADAGLTKLLLDHGASTDIRTDGGMSLAYFAVAFRASEFAAMLLDSTADVTETDSLGLSMLHYAAARGFSDQVRWLLDHVAGIDGRDSNDRTPLFYASLWGHDEVVEILRAGGASIDEAEESWFEGDYLGRSVPGKIPVEFVGDELRTPFGPHGRIVFSPDGDEMLWCHHAMPIQAMWHSRQVNGVWQQPTIAPFTDPALNYADGNPSFSADGNRIYFHTHRPSAESGERKEDSDIWFVERTSKGWGQPTPLGMPVNTGKEEFGPTVAPSGNLYFIGSEYDDTYGTGDIYVSEFVNGVYTTPRNLGPAVNSEHHELSPVAASDESYVVFASDRPVWGRRNLQLYVAFRTDDGAWTDPVSLGRTINRGHTWHPVITADDQYLFYQQGISYYWLSTVLIDDIRKAVVGSEKVSVPGVKIPTLRRSDQAFEHAATNSIALGDLDNDGDLDAVFSNMRFNDSRIYLNDGNGHFAVSEQLLTKQGHGVDLGDLDGDGDLDIFMTCAGYGEGGVEYSRPSRVYFNDGRAFFTMSEQNLGDSVSSGNAVYLHDIDTDGDLDAMVLYYQEDNGIYFNDGKGAFVRSELTFPQGAKWADLDGDGDVDILHREPGVGFKTLLNDGSGHFTEFWTKVDSSINRGGVCFGDIDEDGDLDAVASFLDQSEHRYSSLWYNDGSGRFEETDVKLPLCRYSRMAIGDLNGDGHLDVFLNNFGLPSAVWLNDGQGGLFDSGIRLPGVWMNAGLALGDLDGDGDLDAAIAAFGGGPNEIWFNDTE